MSKLEQLIAELCPDGVEYKALWEVTIWDKKFNAVDNYKQPNIIKYHYFLANELKNMIVESGTVKILTTNTSNLYTNKKLAGKKLSNGEIIAIPWGGNPNIQYYKGEFLTSDNRIATSNDISKLSNKFLYYFMLNNLVLISSFYRGSGIKHPSMRDVLEIQIPLPPLPVQEEIVRILDNFTELTTELKAELVNRKKQYEYYRDSLLTFGDDVERVKLGEVTIMQRGTSVTKNTITKGTIPVISGGQRPAYYCNKFNRDSDVITVSGSGANAGHLIYWQIPIFVCDAFSIKGTKKTITKYIFYYLQSIQQTIYETRRGSGVPHVHISSISTFQIPIPSLAEQQRIVDILDRFDTLCNDISEGLPSEIKARQQQYEYYRDRLLTFGDNVE